MITIDKLNAAKGALTPEAYQWALDNMGYLQAPMVLLGASLKTDKGLGEGYVTKILYLQPADKVASRTLCAAAEASGCKGPCLISSGQLGMSVAQRAATKRTIWYLVDPEAFKAQLVREINRAFKTYGNKLAMRLNGTSDIDWSDVIAQCPQVCFYDYTKVLSRIRANTLPNYHLTFSGSMYSGASRQALVKALARGHNVALAVNTKNLRDDIITTDLVARTLQGSQGYSVASFDTTDLRFLDAPRTIGLLTRKGSSKAQRANEGSDSFFITEENLPIAQILAA